jgi:hypothetical protein
MKSPSFALVNHAGIVRFRKSQDILVGERVPCKALSRKVASTQLVQLDVPDTQKTHKSAHEKLQNMNHESMKDLSRRSSKGTLETHSGDGGNTYKSNTSVRFTLLGVLMPSFFFGVTAPALPARSLPEIQKEEGRLMMEG